MRRIRIQRRGLVPAVAVTILGVLVAYFLSTWGWARLQGSPTGPSTDVGTLPHVVEAPPRNVATTDQYGPIGSVSMVFAGTDVQRGLFGEIDPVWLAVSSIDGAYRALTVDGLPGPGAGAVSVSPDGNRLAWIGDQGVVVYDTVTGDTRTLTLPTAPQAVGAFSPDGSRVLVRAEDGLVVVDVETGEPLSSFDAEPEALRRTAWRPDGTALDFVSGGRLVTGSVPGDETTTQPTDIPERAPIAWSPQGDRLVSLREEGGAKRLYVSEAGEAGLLGEGRRMTVPQVSMDRLIGFSGNGNVAVIARAMDSGAVEQVLDVPLDGGNPADVTTLPAPGENWAGTRTLAIAADTLAFGSTDFEEHLQPWSYPARLSACIVAAVFFLGLFVTRRPRH